jgi:protein-S-isoprenylcysteine O-methyltransferase Ste14
MSLRAEFEKAGSWLFCHRSLLALPTIPIIIAGLWSFRYLGNSRLLDEWWDAACLVTSYFGLAVRILTVGYVPRRTSGRNTKAQVANTLNTTGMYSLMRHPLYLGNYLAVLGLAMFFHTWWMALIITCIYVLYYERIILPKNPSCANGSGPRLRNGRQ